MSDLFKQSLTIAALMGLVVLVYLGFLVITGQFNQVLLKHEKFWNGICRDEKHGPPAVLAVVAGVLLLTGLLRENPWLLGGGFAVVVWCYVKHRQSLVEDPFDE
ncbi:hypothetical protein O4H49_15805 [Kiloniella laminariae]|uniref:Uncharacterized protein n=1 Tax=Kiloniella laminariae TaxID=454162 RepID=A0ABT4LMC2_9PROT|nr:hypothetical protein [Kiloniella laminariae]MCZ4282253.1 hypothetical protein [Kiloniella laminariae]